MTNAPNPRGEATPAGAPAHSPPQEGAEGRRLRAVEPLTPEQAAAAATGAAARALEATGDLTDAVEGARNEAVAELASEVRRLRVELKLARDQGADAETRARGADSSRMEAEDRARGR